MMGGELVFKKDKNLLEMELVREDWMAKPDEEMTEDEKQRYREFLQKEKEFKEKQRKAWEFTLKNVKNEIQEIEINFEERVL
jgi:tellurite resistance protein